MPRHEIITAKEHSKAFNQYQFHSGPQATANIPVDRKILHLMNPMKKIMVATMDMVVRVAVEKWHCLH